MSPAVRIARHEWRLILKEPRFLLPFFITPLLLIGVQCYVLFLSPFESPWETLLLARSLLLMLAVLSASLSVPLGADSFAGERERNTLEILLCLPVSVRTLFWGKVLGIGPLPVLVGWLGQGLLLALIAFKGLLLPGFAAMALRAMLLTPVLGLFFCALSALISLRAETVRGAAQLISLFMLVVLFSVMACSARIFTNTLVFMAVTALLLCGAAACLLLARRRFLRLP